MLAHAMNILGGVGPKTLGVKESLALLAPGVTVTRIDWRGCMATDRRVEAVGQVVRHAMHEGRYPGIVVRYPDGEKWEPLAYVKFVGPEKVVEVWR